MSASKVRKAEFLAGRFCAKQALQNLDPNLKTFELLRTNERGPIWPPGYCGSITHTSTCAAAAVARTTEVFSLGIDSEFILSTYAIQDLKSIATKEELIILGDDLDQGPAMTLLFSAKESVFKCLNPITKRWLEFEDVVLKTREENILCFRIEKENALISCTFEMTEQMVHTLAQVNAREAIPFLRPP